MRAARKYSAVATGITLSRKQFAHARVRVRAEGLDDRCVVELRDCRGSAEAGGRRRPGAALSGARRKWYQAAIVPGSKRSVSRLTTA
jgi:hypothetical protein